jgi:hypothetical protein
VRAQDAVAYGQNPNCDTRSTERGVAMTTRTGGKQSLTLREARTITGLASAVSLTVSAGVGAGAHAAAGPGAGVAAGVVTAAATLWAAIAAIRLLVTCPGD